ncbi:maleylpyruvate isomerase family mycothiol-dependent enzyme [Streptomyces sp. H27-D2]|uniref:maleylpyruvate isomerase family mycothiol-dependent enzyme n=1 Tax=Streptomyces sp. H27-D2 TaxID=3046304 RepID=UPI002DB63CBE|nr:maleylpyruvate isomerase family mycothiol-dependent enzyme [Streptomyces sp. H27-D2]MEC4015024.1 maleylpyruvate isomerase family mycothiol-dependent enzyme [Streptomyces sp. H27-D2]
MKGPGPGTELRDLRTQYQSVRALLEGTTDRDMDLPTSAQGWAVRHQIAHLADTEEVAADTALGGPRTFAEAVRPYAGAEQFTAAGAARAEDRGRDDLVAWLCRAQDATSAALEQVGPDARVPWGLGLSARAFAQARLMETWAHGQDLGRALGAPDELTPEAWHVASLGYETLPFALRRARVRAPRECTLRLELDAGPLGRWAFGPHDATDLVTGTAEAWVKTVTRRTADEARERLRADGSLARLAIVHAKAFL